MLKVGFYVNSLIGLFQIVACNTISYHTVHLFINTRALLYHVLYMYIAG